MTLGKASGERREVERKVNTCIKRQETEIYTKRRGRKGATKRREIRKGKM